VDSAEPLSIRVASDQVEAILLPDHGGRLHRLAAFGHDLLRTPRSLEAYREEPFFWGGFVMAPWCNRVDARPTRVGEHLLDLPSNFADGTAIHGQVYDRAWEVTSAGTMRVLGGGDAWPWRYEVSLQAVVDGPLLRLSHAITNQSDAPMPAGIGIHPWFRTPLEVAFPADAVFASNVTSGTDPEAVSGAFDLRVLQPMPSGLDGTWVRRGDQPVTLRWPDVGIAAVLRAGPSAGYLCAASPAHFDAVAVEPQTHAPNGLRRLLHGAAGGLQTLGTGESLRLDVSLSFSKS
jgi:aldose 1-epimerase